jgi:protein TonB
MDNNMILNNGFNELVFENRHKEYGAYQLRKRYKKSILLACTIAISIFSSGMFLYFASMQNAQAMVAPTPDGVKITPWDASHTIDPPKPKQPDPIVKPVTPPAGPKTPIVNQDLTNPPKITDSKENPPTNKDAGGSPKGDSNSVANNNKPSDPNQGKPCDTCGMFHPPLRVDWTPDSIHDPGLDAFFQKNIHYPEIAKEQNIQGTVWLEFIVDVNGNPKDLKIVKSAHPLLDKEVMRVAPNMPKWKPVTYKGVPCEYIFRKPIRFTLSK